MNVSKVREELYTMKERLLEIRADVEGAAENIIDEHEDTARVLEETADNLHGAFGKLDIAYSVLGCEWVSRRRHRL